MVLMAFYDDRSFLLSHIHHSFVTCDETGMCEMTMLGDSQTTEKLLLRNELNDYYYTEAAQEFLEPAQSLDIVSGMGFMGGHRHRSNTAQRLEKLKKDRQAQAKITHVQWKDSPVTLTEQELVEIFPCKDVPKLKGKPAVKSALTEALQLYPAVPNNPFGDYARFYNRDSKTAPSKKISIYLSMQEKRDFGMEVTCLSGARVCDLVGLVCWMYTNEGREPKLIPPASNYCLKIAEETGEIDEDFPSIDANEFVGKFGFPCLALVEKPVKNVPTHSVIMYVDDEVIKFDVPNTNLTLREVAELTSHKVSITKSTAYHITTMSDSDTAVPLDTRLSNFNDLTFRLVFDKSAKEKFTALEEDAYEAHMRAVEAPLYRTFNVTYCQKIGINYEVQLGISVEKVEIHPLPQKGAVKLLSRQQRPTTLYMDTIATCEIVSKKYHPGRCIFKLIYQQEQEFKKYVFETDPPTAQDIVKKVQLILEMHLSKASKDYQLYRERKLQKKILKTQQSFSKT